MEEELDRRVAALGRKGHRAVAVGIVRGGKRAFAGWSADGAAPDGSTLFEIGSITKVFTGVLLADMVLRSEVALDDPLSVHLPGPRPAWRHREPTLLELATHRSGLPNTPGAMRRDELRYALGLSRRDPWASVTEPDYHRLVAAESPRRPPGTRGRYSSLAVGLLGDALAARAGTSYERLLTERVLEPLGMTDTAVTVPASHAGRLLAGHSRRGRPRPPLQDLMPAAGSLRSSTEDMLRFLAACLQPPPGGIGEALTLAQQPRAEVAKRVQIGLCWLIVSTPAHGRVVWHNGGTWGFRSFAGFAPDHGSAAVVLSNTARSVDRLGFDLAQGRPQESAPRSVAKDDR
ncbi:serine hydrolase domain-containing protein [Blastococcus mobilis]|uniref:CubicO group peptidase, beta-lactamase class C family n=1 Tax=Blastococcus mobilis TaxID=1938746 RepID=A0A239ANW4_9ACTN|nr:serine hydrolase domain-containing protein [Blastococcus mobilis]SNR97220.1 CubicO group peptidase, beta-lactamase class C family [Blastococcus mobilis]